MGRVDKCTGLTGGSPRKGKGKCSLMGVAWQGKRLIPGDSEGGWVWGGMETEPRGVIGWLLDAGWWLLVGGCWLAAGHWWLLGCWLLVAGWLKVVCAWRLVPGLLVVGGWRLVGG